MAIADYASEIAEYNRVLKAFRKSPQLFKQERELLELCQERYQLIYTQIHKVLAPKKTDKSENEIREHIRNVFALDLPVCEAKIKMFTEALNVYEKRKDKEKEDLCYRYLQDWLTLYENFYAVVAFRSFEHFALFMEWDRPEKDKVWKPSIDPYNDGGYTGVSKPFFYFFNQMVLLKKIKFISKQMFTGGGKSFSNQFAFAWLLGIDKDNDILDVLGNPSLVLMNAKGTVEIMTNPRFARVFPEYQQFFDNAEDSKSVRDLMFSTCRIKEGELTVTGSTKPINLRIVSKSTSVDGVRCRFLFLDDVCRSTDMTNLKAHEKDIRDFWNDWWKRQYNNEDFYIVVSGTAYSVNDIISHLIAYYSKGKMQRTKESKYTYQSLDGTAIFIKIPKIDDELDRSTYPSKFPYSEAIKIRDRDLNTFLAMEQQQPQNPETSPLCYEKINTYEELPEGLSEYSYACLDPARTGKNYVTMGIHRVRQEIDKYNEPIERHYLVDCIFQLKQMSELYGEICDKVERHHIIKLHIENNTDTSLAYVIGDMLHKRGIYFCEISEVFSNQNKEEKIRENVYGSEGYFKNVMVYPAMSVFAPSSQMGKFMLYLTAYDYYKVQEYDDSIDEECMYIAKFVANKGRNTKAKVLYV